MLRILLPAPKWSKQRQEMSFNLNELTKDTRSFTIGSCLLCDFRVNRKEISPIHLVFSKSLFQL